MPALAKGGCVHPARLSARDRRQLCAQIPELTDLLAAGVSAGAQMPQILTLIGPALAAPLGPIVQAMSTQLAGGVTALGVWQQLADDACMPHQLRHLAQALARAAQSGAPLGLVLAAVGDDVREQARWEQEAAIRRAESWAVLPLIVCFLPAFLLTAVIPQLVMVASQLGLSTNFR